MNVFSSLASFTGRRALARAIVVCAALAGATAAQADDRPRVLYDLNLSTSLIRLESIDALSVRYEDEFGSIRSRPTSSILAILPATDWPDLDDEPDRQAWILLTDGQRYPGRLAPTAGDEDMVAWSHDEFGHMEFPIESVRAVSMPGADIDALRVELSSEATEDVVMLANGDRIEGFVVALTGQIEIETQDAGLLTFEPDRVEWVLLATEDKPLTGMAIWLRDGAVAALAETRAANGNAFEARLASGASATFKIEDIEAIVFNAERLHPLSSIEPEKESPIGRRALIELTETIDLGPVASPGARLSVAPDLRLPGPMRVEWDLPTDAVRFSTTAEMPRAAFPWGDCELVIAVDDVELVRVRLNEESPTASISIDVRGRKLTISVEPGEYGPVRDQVILRKPMLLTGGLR